MAIVVTSLQTSGTGNQSSGASLTSAALNTGASIGDLVLVAIGSDNAGTSGANSISSVTDSQGNTYTQVVLKNDTPGSSQGDGATAALYQSVLTTALVSGTDTITVNFSPNTTAKAFRVIKVTGANTTNYGTDVGNGAGTTYSVTASPSMASGDLIIGIVAGETNTASTTDSDTTNGSWTALTAVSGGSGGDGTKMSVSLQYKIVNASGAQTFNGNNGSGIDWAAAYALYTVPANSIPNKTYMTKQAVNRTSTY